MKNAIYFFSFNLLLIVIYIYSQNIIFSQQKSNLLSGDGDQAVNFNHTFILDNGYLDIRGKVLEKIANTINISFPEGNYISKDSKLSFSAKNGFLDQGERFVLKQDAKVISDSNKIISDELAYHIKEKKILSSSKTILIFNNITIEGTNFEYDLEKKLFKASSVRGNL